MKYQIILFCVLVATLGCHKKSGQKGDQKKDSQSSIPRLDSKDAKVDPSKPAAPVQSKTSDADEADDPQTDVREDDDSAVPARLIPQSYLLTNETIGVVYNTLDSESVALAMEYQKQWEIPDAHMIAVEFASVDVMSRTNFGGLYDQIVAGTPPGIVGYAVAWIRPFRASCLSITSAIALGPRFQELCDDTFFDGPCRGAVPQSSYDFRYHNQKEKLGTIKPAMMIHTGDLAGSLALIDRGRASVVEETVQSAKEFLVYDNGTRSNVRVSQMMRLDGIGAFDPLLTIDYRDRREGDDYIISDESDIMFYFTGATRVFEIESNSYLPGALADHVTSFGGRVLGNNGQMPITEWMAAGVTGSFGTVVEPCAVTAKFPDVNVVTENYLSGMPLLWAYWSSVRAPAEGLFMGDPLAKPYPSVQNLSVDGTTLTFDKFLREDSELDEAPAETGPWTSVKYIGIDQPQVAHVEYDDAKPGHFYRVVRGRVFSELVERVELLSVSGTVGALNLASGSEQNSMWTSFTQLSGVAIVPRALGCFQELEVFVGNEPVEVQCDNCDTAEPLDERRYTFAAPTEGVNQIRVELGCNSAPGVSIIQRPGDFNNDRSVSDADMVVYQQILAAIGSQGIDFLPLLDLDLNQMLGQGDIDVLQALIDESAKPDDKEDEKLKSRQ